MWVLALSLITTRKWRANKEKPRAIRCAGFYPSFRTGGLEDGPLTHQLAEPESFHRCPEIHPAAEVGGCWVRTLIATASS